MSKKNKYLKLGPIPQTKLDIFCEIVKGKNEFSVNPAPKRAIESQRSDSKLYSVLLGRRFTPEEEDVYKAYMHALGKTTALKVAFPIYPFEYLFPESKWDKKDSKGMLKDKIMMQKMVALRNKLVKEGDLTRKNALVEFISPEDYRNLYKTKEDNTDG